MTLTTFAKTNFQFTLFCERRQRMNRTSSDFPARYLLCADWAKEGEKRVCYVADVVEKTIKLLDASNLTLSSLLEHAARYANDGKVLLSFDVAIGVPSAFFVRVQKEKKWAHCQNFLEWLATIDLDSDFWIETKNAAEWNAAKPFISVPAGKGSLTAFNNALGRSLRRNIDVRFGGKSPFIVNGFPGTVGSATRSFWKELIPILTPTKTFSVWPFEGDFGDAFQKSDVVVAENYPAISYTSVFASKLPSARLKLSKTKVDVRKPALAAMEDLEWLKKSGITLPCLTKCQESEDHFDAFMSALSQLRIVLEKLPMSHPSLTCPKSEGGILGSGVIQIEERSKSLDKQLGCPPGKKSKRVSESIEGKREYPCPIPLCPKVFYNTRSGWDGHVGTHRMHPDWYPDVEDHAERLRLFRQDFPQFFQ
jgi:hypothetical protein